MAIHENLVSAREAARILNVTPTRIAFLCRQGRFENAEKIGSGWIIPLEAVMTHKRLSPGAKPRGYKDKEYLMQIKAEASNFKEDVSHD